MFLIYNSNVRKLLPAKLKKYNKVNITNCTEKCSICQFILIDNQLKVQNVSSNIDH